MQKKPQHGVINKLIKEYNNERNHDTIYSQLAIELNAIILYQHRIECYHFISTKTQIDSSGIERVFLLTLAALN